MAAMGMAIEGRRAGGAFSDARLPRAAAEIAGLRRGFLRKLVLRGRSSGRIPAAEPAPGSALISLLDTCARNRDGAVELETL